MSSLVNCPHCSTRVLPMAGRICPACRKNVDAEPNREPTPEQAAVAVHRFAAEQMAQGIATSEIQKGLTARGLNAEAAATLVGNVKRVKAQVEKRAGQQNMLRGALWFIGGLCVTAYTYRAAAAGGGRYVIAWGAVVYGGIRFLRGLSQWAGE